jgi:acyl-CoA synthetase (AMP-forming)/AMP-acid ligase II
VPIVGVVGRDFDDLLRANPMTGQLPADARQPALIAFTSGTTRDPKGVIHSHQTIGFETRQLSGRHPQDRGALLTAVPVGHFMGMLSAFLTAVLAGEPVNLTDVWDPATVLALMKSDALCVGGGAAYHVTSLLDHPDFTPAHLAAMKYAGLGGAPIPAAVTERLTAKGITVYRSYGSTEHPSVTGSHYSDGTKAALHRRQSAARGGASSRSSSRSPPARLHAPSSLLPRRWRSSLVSPDGTARLRLARQRAFGARPSSAQSPPRITPWRPASAPPPGPLRRHTHPASTSRSRYHLPPKPHTPLPVPHLPVPAPTLAQLRVHLEQAGLARQKWPEEIHQVDDFPRTASGKIQKYLLRNEIALTD